MLVIFNPVSMSTRVHTNIEKISRPVNTSNVIFQKRKIPGKIIKIGNGNNIHFLIPSTILIKVGSRIKNKIRGYVITENIETKATYWNLLSIER